MAGKLVAMVKLQIPAGKANPAPPVGPALGQHGVNIMEFCKAFNAATQAQMAENLIIPVVISIYSDRSFTFITKTPTVTVLIKKSAKIAKGSGMPNREKVGKITRQEAEKIAQTKMKDLNAKDLNGAVKMVIGTARSMGVDVEENREVASRQSLVRSCHSELL